MAKKKSKKDYSKIYGLLYLASAVLILLYLFFNDQGILKYIEVKERIENLNTQINATEKQIDRVKAEIDSLKNSIYKIEKTARENYNMRRPNEKGLDFDIK